MAAMAAILHCLSMLPTKFQVNWPFGSEEAKNRFSRQQDGGHLGFLIETILAIFDLQVTLMLFTKFQVYWPRDVGGTGVQSELLTSHKA